ncbi:transposase [Photobacterium kishitanii]|uniref:Transposase IS116/IS110/IS902 C-terminal domain-containing protein n=1 Tax=Photobacterium kishitanii TaxID=318456 RepID=A0AAX0YY42_9GAMM|nr:hypothetical protein CTM84_20765 [Photobacterium kishitanii]PSX19266.1 hypothetical protein C0W70_12365 [Photobacterium kishitanii]PSX28082.1 hypothetical protein C0W52_10880 [Photobacterium kishitanii]PSX32196.1 hypothetical protein C0W39_12860 [Photobacterium kishitanii]PSX46452.1 hypothetical protein C0W53_05660 [Photobacterium kishitanii]
MCFFSTAKQAAVFVGLTPRLNESGSFKRMNNIK